MKFYISVDMEGIAGIILPQQLRRGESLYNEARQLLTKEVNVIVESLVQEGATEIIVKDAHSSGFNFLMEHLHPAATYCVGGLKTEQRFAGVDASFDGAFLIGYHGKGGVKDAIRDHTMTSKGWQYLKLNGHEIGEIGLDSLLFGLHEVPVLLVTGDDKTCAEAKETLEHVTTYQTKIGLGRHRGLLKAPQKVYQDLEGVIKQAVENKAKVQPYTLKAPYELLIHFISTDIADSRYYDGKESIRLNGLEALYKGTDLVQLFGRAL